MVQKHFAFAPACQKQLGSRLRSPFLRRGTMPALSLSHGFFTIYSLRQAGNLTEEGVEGVRPYPEECHKSEQ